MDGGLFIIKHRDGSREPFYSLIKKREINQRKEDKKNRLRNESQKIEDHQEFVLLFLCLGIMNSCLFLFVNLISARNRFPYDKM